MLLCNYPTKYRKDTKSGFKWLNENASLYDFEVASNLFTRLTIAVETAKGIKELFSCKNTSVFVTAFKAFTESGRKDEEYGEFLKWFIGGGKETEIDGKTWDELDITQSTRDSNIVHGKIDYLAALMERYFKEAEKAA